MGNSVQSLLFAFILLLCFTAMSCKDESAAFSNLIDVKNSPTSPGDEGLNAFFDLGSWMGFSLSDNDTTTGFSGPYILGLDHGLWVSDNFISLDLMDDNDHSLLTNLKSSEQNYFPGELVNRLNFENIEITSSLFYASDRSVIISSTILNNSEQKVCFSPKWEGEIFSEMGEFVRQDSTLMTLLDKNQKIFIKPINDEVAFLEIDSNNYAFSQKSICLTPQEARVFSIEIRYHPDQIGLSKDTKKPNVAVAKADSKKRWGKYLEITRNKSLTYEERLILTKSICTLINNWRSAAGELRHDGLFPSYHYIAMRIEFKTTLYVQY